MKTLFFNARLIDSKIDSVGALLISDEIIEEVFLGNYPTEEKAAQLVKDFLQTKNVGMEDSQKIVYVDCQGKTLMPSFIDMHVHFRYPGQTEKEDLETGLNAAVAGGFGTLVLMPNTNPVVSSSELSHSIEEEAAQFNKATVIQTVSITKDFSGTDTSHLDEVERVLMITEDGRDVPTSAVMLEAMEKAASYGMIMGCHCEDVSLTTPAKKCRTTALELIKQLDENPENCDVLSAQIDANLEEANMLLALAEDIATERNIELAKASGCKLHIDHVSTKNAIEAIRRGKASGMKITCEITPHHFGLDCERPGMLRYLVNPPIRNKKDRAALLKALADGTCDVIATDHAPHTAQDKANGSPGFPGLETAFAVAHTELVTTGFITMQRLSELMSKNPASILGLDNFNSDENLPCGMLEKNYLGNIVIIDLDAMWTVNSAEFKTKGKVCPFEGKKLQGKVTETWYKGKRVF